MKYKNSLCVLPDGSEVDLAPQVGDLIDIRYRNGEYEGCFVVGLDSDGGPEVLELNQKISVGPEITQEITTLVMREGCISREEWDKKIIEPNEQAFIDDMLEAVWTAGSYDGADIQIIAQRHGILKPETRTESCGEGCNCAGICDDGGPWICYRRVATKSRPEPPRLTDGKEWIETPPKHEIEWVVPILYKGEYCIGGYDSDRDLWCFECSEGSVQASSSEVTHYQPLPPRPESTDWEYASRQLLKEFNSLKGSESPRLTDGDIERIFGTMCMVLPPEEKLKDLPSIIVEARCFGARYYRDHYAAPIVCDEDISHHLDTYEADVLWVGPDVATEIFICNLRGHKWQGDYDQAKVDFARYLRENSALVRNYAAPQPMPDQTVDEFADAPRMTYKELQELEMASQPIDKEKDLLLYISELERKLQDSEDWKELVEEYSAGGSND